MKPGIYRVRGNAGHDAKTPIVSVTVSSEKAPTGGTVTWAAFSFAGFEWLYRDRIRSPFPERVEPAKLGVIPPSDATAARSIAHTAFFDAACADSTESQRPADPSESDVDTLTIGAMRARSAGPEEGRYTRHGK